MPIRHARLITACGLIRKKVVDCGISDRNILSLEYRPVHNLYITLNRFFMAYIHLHRKEMYYTQFFLIRNPFIRNQYSISFRINKPSTHVPSACKKLASHFSKKRWIFVQKWRKSRTDKKPQRNWVLKFLIKKLCIYERKRLIMKYSLLSNKEIFR